MVLFVWTRVSTTSKSLGVLTDTNLTWGSHIEKLAKKNRLCFCSYQTGEAICSPSNIASHLQSLDSAAFRLWQCCFGELWHKTIRQSSKTPKSCSVSLNVLKLWRRCIAAIPQPRTNYLRNSFRFSGAVLWNNLPKSLRKAESQRNFKSFLHSHYEVRHDIHGKHALYMYIPKGIIWYCI